MLHSTKRVSACAEYLHACRKNHVPCYCAISRVAEVQQNHTCLQRCLGQGLKRGSASWQKSDGKPELVSRLCDLVTLLLPQEAIHKKALASPSLE